jgi:hypothetical protein
MVVALEGDRLAKATRAIAAWQTCRGTSVACPVCGRAGLAILDRSARPHAEWYALSCAGCGLDETLHIPLGPPVEPMD